MAVTLKPSEYVFDEVRLFNQDVLEIYNKWEPPDVIISDGGYGVSGFKGDAKTPSGLLAWYTPHIKAWFKYALPGTTLWFWNTEIGWAVVHPVLAENGWDYVCCNIWDKGIQHAAGNTNTKTLKHFPVVTEVCVQYVKRSEFPVTGQVLSLKEWLRYEWERSGLQLYKTNEACGVRNAASRKYFTKDHLWYPPPPSHFEKLAFYANRYGNPEGKPYFSIDGKKPVSRSSYEDLLPTFDCPIGITNVWNYPPLHGPERIRINGTNGKYAHLNQKPVKLIQQIIEASSTEGDVIWEPFGGLCTAGSVAYRLARRAFCAEIDEKIFRYAIDRFESSFLTLNLKQRPRDNGKFTTKL